MVVPVSLSFVSAQAHSCYPRSKGHKTVGGGGVYAVDHNQHITTSSCVQAGQGKDGMVRCIKQLIRYCIGSRMFYILKMFELYRQSTFCGLKVK